MKKILHISTGGTIAQTKNTEGIAVPSEKHSALTDTLQQFIKTAHIDATIDSVEIVNKDSSNIAPEDWNMMVKTIVSNYDAFDAFIITHGTNTLGYTASSLSFALGNIGKRVILTGSQVSYGYIGSDAEMNLANSIRMATLDTHDIVGVFAVFGSHIITGTRVKKTTEFDYDAFKTFGRRNDIGRIGRMIHIDESALEDHMKWISPRASQASELEIQSNFDTNIILITEFPGMQSELLIQLANLGIKGIVYRASGAGDPNIGKSDAPFQNLRKGFEYLREKEIPIVVTTYAADGVASMDVNEPGFLARELGAIPGWDMSLETMTVKLGWLLGKNCSYADIQQLMTTSLRGEIDNPKKT